MSALDNRTGRHRYRDTDEQTPRVSGHGHGHGHGPARPASHRVRILLVAVLAPVALATLIGLWLTWPGAVPRSNVDVGFGQRPVAGQVLATMSAPCTSGNAAGQGKR